MCYFFDGIVCMRNKYAGGRKKAPDGADSGKRQNFVQVCNISSGSSEPGRKLVTVFLWFFFLGSALENMSVLPTNAAVFYVIFIDKDVDKF